MTLSQDGHPNSGKRAQSEKIDGDQSLSSLDKGERRLVCRIQERLTTEGLANFRSEALALTERERTRALNVLVEQHCAIITKASTLCDLSKEQLHVTRAYASFMRELGFSKHANRITAHILPISDPHGISSEHQPLIRDITRRQIELGKNGDMIRVASGLKNLRELLDTYPAYADWIKEVVAKQVEKVENGDMIRVAMGLKDLTELLDAYPAHTDWIKEVVAKQIEKVENGDMIRVAMGLKDLTELLDTYPAHADWIKEVVAKQVEKVENGDMIRVASGLKDWLGVRG